MLVQIDIKPKLTRTFIEVKNNTSVEEIQKASLNVASKIAKKDLTLDDIEIFKNPEAMINPALRAYFNEL